MEIESRGAKTGIGKGQSQREIKKRQGYFLFSGGGGKKGWGEEGGHD